MSAAANARTRDNVIAFPGAFTTNDYAVIPAQNTPPQTPADSASDARASLDVQSEIIGELAASNAALQREVHDTRAALLRTTTRLRSAQQAQSAAQTRLDHVESSREAMVDRLCRSLEQITSLREQNTHLRASRDQLADAIDAFLVLQRG